MSLQSIPTPAASLQHSQSLTSHPRLSSSSSGGLNDIHSSSLLGNYQGIPGQFVGQQSRSNNSGMFNDGRGFGAYPNEGGEGNGNSDFNNSGGAGRYPQ